MSKKIENVWDSTASPPDLLSGHCNLYEIATVSGADDELLGTIAIRKDSNMFWTGPYGGSEAQPDYFLGSDVSISEEMAEEYYTGVPVSGAGTIVEDNITHRILEDE